MTERREIQLVNWSEIRGPLQSEAIGITKSINSGRDKTGRLRSHTVCGILMHSSLAATTDGLPLGLTAVKFWTRKKFKGTAALKTQQIGTHFLITTCVDRLAGDGDHTIAEEMDEVAVKGLHRAEVRDNSGDPDEAVLEIRYRPSLAADRKAEAISRADVNGDPCREARDTKEQKEN
jgi:hypothetical protein